MRFGPLLALFVAAGAHAHSVPVLPSACTFDPIVVA